jgi:hypothetical protein
MGTGIYKPVVMGTRYHTSTVCTGTINPSKTFKLWSMAHSTEVNCWDDTRQKRPGSLVAISYFF